MTREEQIKKAAHDFSWGWCDDMAHPLNDGFIKGAEWADSHPHWISVEERLPKPHFADTSSDWVLVCVNHSGVYIDSYNHKHGEWCNNCKSVTNWMPLPEAPRKEEKK